MLTVVFENPHFLVLDKASGWLTVPSRMGIEDARPCLGIELEKSFGRVWPVHRLDFEVSGLVLFARDAQAHRAASMWFEKRLVHKRYSALSEGTREASWKPGLEFTWKSRILRGKKRAFESPHGKDAVTRAVWRGASEKGLVWELEPLTGRSHQLRFELTRHGFPIVGDVLYGSTKTLDGGGIALRSVLLDFSGCADATGFGLPARLSLTGFELA